MRKISTALFMTASLALAGSAFSAEGWMEDFEAAKAKAAEEKKDLFIEFTGSDWCPPCMAMKENIFSKSEFLTPAGEAFILVSLDFPRSKEQSPEIKAQNQALQEKYKVRGFPSVVLADTDGTPYHMEVGGRQEEAADYTQRIIGQKSVRTDRDAAFAEADKAEGLEKAKLLKKGLDTMSAETVDTFYSEKIDEAIDLDPEDTLGYRKAQDTKKKLGALEGELQALGRAGKTDEFLARIDAFISENELEGAARQDVMMRKFAIIGRDQLELAEKVANEVLKIDATTEPGKMAQSIKDQIAGMKAATKPE